MWSPRPRNRRLSPSAIVPPPNAPTGAVLLSRRPMPFASLIRRLRPLPRAEVEALAAYRDRIAPVALQVSEVRDRWLEMVAQHPVDDQLANSASVHRWELSRLAADMEGIEPPPVAASVHHQVRRAVGDAARGCQLLATGSRFHKSEAICDGQVLLVDAAESLQKLLADLDGRLARS